MWRKDIDIRSLSFCAHYLRFVVKETGKELATGTGFIYRFHEQLFLVTNGHNITRVNPETGMRLTNHAGFPTCVRTIVRTENRECPTSLGNAEMELSLYYDPNSEKPKWFMHKELGYDIDVIAIPIDGGVLEKNNVKLFPINDSEFKEEFHPQVSDDVFVLGYPFNITGGQNLPIWKRGTIATEVGVDIDNKPKMFIDTATRSGMSGAPVIYQSKGFHRHPSGDIKKSLLGTIRGLLGVYSGRIGAEDNLQAQLGIVWKASVIDEIIDGFELGSIEFQKL